ncbi:hypothetical protein XELAEV_18033373mg [Xenopus laevis]|uniref:Uncharacterized protein n=1 Tax=Xenopus laevis TaxID=8355 RepID=A0A974CJS4_XENLA|nr:hypothetical protein XELAEV_18033373mg [Xenopus laevis]
MLIFALNLNLNLLLISRKYATPQNVSKNKCYKLWLFLSLPQTVQCFILLAFNFEVNLIININYKQIAD